MPTRQFPPRARIAVLALCAFSGAAAAAGEPWPIPERTAFVNGCAESIATKSIRDYQARGGKAPDEAQRRQLLNLLRDTCLCIQRKLEAQFTYREFIADPKRTEGVVMAHAAECTPRRR